MPGSDDIELLDNGELRLPVADGEDIDSDGGTSVYSGLSTGSPYLRRTGSNTSFGFRGSFGRRPTMKGAAQPFDYDLKYSKHRLAVREMVLSKNFERAMVLLVVVNCVLLAIYDFSIDKAGRTSFANDLSRYSNYGITSVFVLEVFAKIVGCGMFIEPWKPPPSSKKPVVAAHTGGYFRDPWNIIDFVITAVTFVALFDSGSAFGGLRAFRVLRIFKHFESLSIKILINTVTSSIPKLLRVFAIFMILLLVLSVLGVSLWQGEFRHRCVAVVAGDVLNTTASPGSHAAFMKALERPSALLRNGTVTPLYSAIMDALWEAEATGLAVPCAADAWVSADDIAGNPAALAPLRECLYPTNPILSGDVGRMCSPGELTSCPFGYACTPVRNPYWGNLGFDNTGQSMLAMIVVMSLHGWSDVMYMAMASIGPGSSAYFVTAVLAGAFFIINLALVIIIYAFEKMHRRCVAEHTLRERKKRAVESLRGERNTVAAGATKTLKFKLKAVMATGTAESLTQGMPCEIRVRGVWVQGVAGVISHDEIKVYCEGGVIYTATRMVDVKPIPDAKWRCAARKLTRSAMFDRIAAVVSILNLIALAADHHPQPDGLQDVLHAMYMVFYGYYCAEFLLKLTGFGLLPYLRDSWNVLDFGIVVGCTVGLATGKSSFMYITTLRGVRLIRMFKASLRLLTLRKWVLVVTRSLRSALCLVFLYAILVFTYALMGMQLLAGEYCNTLPDCVPDPTADDVCQCNPRENYDTISNAMFSVFRVLMGEAWGAEMMRAMDIKGPSIAIFYISLYFIGNYLFLNLFVAIFFHQARVVEAAEAFTAVVRSREENDASQRELPGMLGSVQGSATNSPRSPKSPRSPFGSKRGKMFDWGQGGDDPMTRGSPVLSEPLISAEMSPVGAPGNRDGGGGNAWDADDRLGFGSMTFSDEGDPLERDPEIVELERSRQIELERALFCLPATAGWRIQLAKVVESTPFSIVVLAGIVLSTISLSLDTPLLPPDTAMANTVATIDLAVTIFFTAEMMARILAYGFVMHRTSYLRRDFCSVIDFFVVMASLLAYATGQSNLQAWKVLRLIRPLRFIGTSLGLRVVVTSLVHSTPALVSVCFISAVVWTSWSIMGVQLFKGSLYQCTEKEYGDLTGVVDTVGDRTFNLRYKPDCEEYAQLFPERNIRWQDYFSSFDNTARALLALFEIAAHGGWAKFTLLCVDSVGIDEAPMLNNEPLLALYFISFIVIGGFFVRALFVTVVLDSYTTDAQRLHTRRGVGMLTDSQKLWIQSYREMLRSAKKPPEFFYSKNKGACVRFARSIVGKPAFEYFVQGCIIANIAIMATQHFEQSQAFTNMQNAAEFVFLGVFWMEFFLKLVAFRVKGYFAQKWNRFDFIVLLLITPGVIIETTMGGGVGAAAGVLRVIRFTRVLKLFRTARGVIIVINAIFFSLPGVANVCGVLALFTVICVSLSMTLFGHASRTDALTEDCNFESAPVALLTLFRVGTGERWPEVLAALRRDDLMCESHLDGCVSPVVAIIFCVVYVFVTMFVLNNLFIGVLYDAFLTVVREAKTEGDLKKQHMLAFRTAWGELDPDKEFKISAALLPALLKGTGPPLGVRRDVPMPQVWQVIAELDINCVDGDVDMQTILQALFLRLVGTPEEIDMPGFLIEAVTVKADQRFQAGKRDEKIARSGAESLPVHVIVGVVKAQAAVRGNLARRRIRQKYKESRAQVLRKAGVVAEGPAAGTKQFVLPAAE